MNDEWGMVIKSLNTKLSDLTEEERSDFLLKLNNKLGIQSEFTEILS